MKIEHFDNFDRQEIYTHHTCFRIPQLDVAIVRRTQELGAIVVEADISGGLLVTRKRPDKSPLVIYLP